MAESLFDYGKELNVTQEDLDQMRTVEIVWPKDECLGGVFNEATGVRTTLYKVDGEVVKYEPGTGIED